MSLVFAVLVLLLPVGCGSNDASGTGRTEGSSTQAAHRSRPSAADSHEERRLTAAFGLLRTPAEGLPPKVRRALLRDALPGMQWSRSQRLPVSLPGAYWLVPGTQAVCVVARSRPSSPVGNVCAPIPAALHHGIANTTVTLAPPSRTVVGVAPDGVRRVSIRSPKSVTDVQVRHGGLFTLRDSIAEGPETFILHPH